MTREDWPCSEGLSPSSLWAVPPMFVLLKFSPIMPCKPAQPSKCQELRIAPAKSLKTVRWVGSVPQGADSQGGFREAEAGEEAGQDAAETR